MKIETYLPDRILSNTEISRMFPEWSEEKIESKTGIRNRHISAVDEFAGDMAVKAAEKLFEYVPRESVDLLIYCTLSEDYILPQTSTLIHSRLKLNPNITTIDLHIGCTGFINCLAVAKGMIVSGIAKNALILTADVLTKHIAPTDKANLTLLGDGAAATFIDKQDAENIGEFDFGTIGDVKGIITTYGGAMKVRYDKDAPVIIDVKGLQQTINHFTLDGHGFFNFAIDVVPGSIKNVLEKNHLQMEEIDYVVFHQSTQFVLEFLREISGIDEKKFCIDMLDTGNTSCVTIPLAMRHYMDNGTIHPGMKIMLSGFGAGLSWGSVIITT